MMQPANSVRSHEKSRFSEAEADAASRGREAVMVVDARGHGGQQEITVRKGFSPEQASEDHISQGYDYIQQNTQLLNPSSHNIDPRNANRQHDSLITTS